MTIFWETMLLLAFKRQDIVHMFLKNCSKYGLPPVPDLGPEPEAKTETFPKSKTEPQ
jgi:hypothetical protein